MPDMPTGAALVCLAAAAAIAADALVHPRSARLLPRSIAGTSLILLTFAALFGMVLAITGTPPVSGAAVAILMAGLTLISNAKRKVLGEPLVFTDLALIAAVLQHPQFYFSALRPMQIAGLAAGVAVILAAFASLSVPGTALRAAGLLVAAGGLAALLAVLALLERGEVGAGADLDRDVKRHGLVPILWLYWWRWRSTGDAASPAARSIPGASRQLVVVVQCESFADPQALLGEHAAPLPGLAAARAMAAKAGRLMVSGFGAYTMRTEYGVLFGRDEEELGLRRFDPFLTASRDTGHALANRLDAADWDRIFVHPHDLRFYNRASLMPQAGFSQLVGEDAFAPPPAPARYVPDAAIGDAIVELAKGGSRACLIYAVTIENHGPWAAARKGGDPAAPYLELLSRGDALLTRLIADLPGGGRPVTLCFFGDHRPSIPGACEPGSERHTPYVLLRFDPDGKALAGSPGAIDLTPAQLHHAILSAIRSWELEGQEQAVA